MSEAGEGFLANLDSITVADMCDTAQRSGVLDDEKVTDFAVYPWIGSA
jgi:hypothetical protein